MIVSPDVSREVDVVAARLASARSNLDAAWQAAREMSVRLLDEGKISENQLASRLDVNRSTVRGWRKDAER